MDSSQPRADIPYGRQLRDLMLAGFESWQPDSPSQPWFSSVQAALDELAVFKKIERYDPRSEWFQLRTWNLYAINRANDALLLPFQYEDNSGGTPLEVHAANYLDFFTAFGFMPFDSNEFASFRHEIVRVIQAEDDEEPITVQETLWSGWMWGDMLFSRSGVVVRGGRKHIVKEVAEGSTLYFTYRRHRRRTFDSSYGWGSNSQWRTEFRRDYECDGKWYYNLEGRDDLNHADPCEEDPDGLTLAERIELCKNRCFLTTTKDSRDLLPYYRFEEPIT